MTAPKFPNIIYRRSPNDMNKAAQGGSPMTHPSPTAEDFAAATERAQSFLSDSQFIGADRNIARCFLEQSKRIAALEAELASHKEWRDSVSSAVKNLPEFHSGFWGGDKEGWGFHFEVINWMIRELKKLRAEKAEAQLATRLPDREALAKRIKGKLRELLDKPVTIDEGAAALAELVAGASTALDPGKMPEEIARLKDIVARERVCSAEYNERYRQAVSDYESLFARNVKLAGRIAELEAIVAEPEPAKAAEPRTAPTPSALHVTVIERCRRLRSQRQLHGLEEALLDIIESLLTSQDAGAQT